MIKETSEATRSRDNGSDREQANGLTNKSHEVAEQARQIAMDRVDSVRQSTQTAKQQAADKIRKLGATVRKVGEHMRVEDQTYIAQKAATASDQLETFADYVNSAEISTLVRDTRTLARSNPAVFFGTAAALGFVAGRFLKGVSDVGAATGESSHERARPRPAASPRQKASP
jgi:ElaB/YqjD/DUF883 family membrane-anchored ribosome-binding protein